MNTYRSNIFLLFVLGIMAVSAVASQDDPDIVDLADLIGALRETTVGILVDGLDGAEESILCESHPYYNRAQKVKMIASDLVATPQDDTGKWKNDPCYDHAKKIAVDMLKKKLLAAATTKDEASIKQWRKHPYYADAHDKLLNELADLEASSGSVDRILKCLATPVIPRISSNSDH